MEGRVSGFKFGFREKVALLILITCIIDAFVASYIHIRYGDLLFIEGILVFAAGAYIAAGVANLHRETWTSLTAGPESHKEFLEEQRAKQVADGVLLMIIGAILIAISIIYFAL
jgi:hypothetical protein